MYSAQERFIILLVSVRDIQISIASFHLKSYAANDAACHCEGESKYNTVSCSFFHCGEKILDDNLPNFSPGLERDCQKIDGTLSGTV